MSIAADIVIPVYNAYEFTRKCIESIEACTSFEGCRILVVDDCSPDTRIRAYLDSVRSDHLVVLSNETNKGFVASANKGIAYSGRDVVLLNSDTEVTPRWLEKLSACAYSDEKIATATPFSNNATICSIPEFCRENSIPSGFTADGYAALVERVSLRRYPEIPTAVGFCMYIKRSVLDRIGPLDEETFRKGYGEENDFCYRASRAGYRHVLCDDTFVWHKGTMSFQTGEKEANIRRNMEVLEKRYPRERKRTLTFIGENPLRPLTDNINFFSAFANGKKGILYILHMPVPYREGDSQAGGTQKHVLELARSFKEEYNVFVLWPERNRGLCVVGFSAGQVKELFFRFSSLAGKSREEKTDSCLQNLAAALAIDLIHIHHVLHLGRSIFQSCEALGVPIFFTAHDYYMLCPRVNMIRDGRFCGADFSRCASCTGCGTWLEQSRSCLQACKKIVVPDASAVEYFRKAAQGDSLPEIVEIPHGIGLSAYDIPVFPSPERENKVFRVAFVGSMNPIKGSEVVRELLHADTGGEIQWHLFGETGETKFHKTKFHKTKFHGKTADAVFHGRYQSQAIPRLLSENRIDLACFFPMWPETFNYTLTECWIAGVPTLSYEIGALGRRTKCSGCGYLLPFGTDPEEILQAIRGIMEDQAGYQNKKDALARYKPVTLPQMVAQYRELYAGYALGSRHGVKSYDKELFLRAIAEASSGTETLGAVYGSQLRQARAGVRRLLPPAVADFILNGRYPFKKQMKKAAAALMTRIKKYRGRG